MYADDLTLLAPSAKGLQKLLDTCETYANKHEMVFNSKRSVFMCIEAKCAKPMHIPSLILKKMTALRVSTATSSLVIP